MEAMKTTLDHFDMVVAAIFTIGVCAYGAIVLVKHIPSSKWEIGPGYIRSMEPDYMGGKAIVFETDGGKIYSFNVCDAHPPLWVGMHGKISMDSCNLRVVDHMPPDLQIPEKAK